MTRRPRTTREGSALFQLVSPYRHAFVTFATYKQIKKKIIMQKTITFNKSTRQGYASEALIEVDNDFAVSLKLERPGTLTMFLSTIEGTEGQRKGSYHTDDEGNFDEDFDALIFRKYVTIRTTAPVVGTATLTIKEE